MNKKSKDKQDGLNADPLKQYREEGFVVVPSLFAS